MTPVVRILLQICHEMLFISIELTSIDLLLSIAFFEEYDVTVLVPCKTMVAFRVRIFHNII